MKKSISVLLFVAIVSNNLFGQDTIIRTVSNQYGDYNLETDSYISTNKKSNLITDITFKKDSIIIGDFFNSVYKIIEINELYDSEQGNEKFYYCIDPEGKKCHIIVKDRNNLYKYPLIMISYSDGAYFYYTR